MLKNWLAHMWTEVCSRAKTWLKRAKLRLKIRNACQEYWGWLSFVLFNDRIRKYVRSEGQRLLGLGAVSLLLLILSWAWWHFHPDDHIAPWWFALSIPIAVGWLLVLIGFWSTVHPRDFIAALTSIAAIVIAGITAHYTGRQAVLLSQQIRLENRPFTSIEKPLWWSSEDQQGNFWFWMQVRRNNYGERPAEELRLRNFRAVNLTIRQELLEQKIRKRAPEVSRQRFEEYLQDERNRLVLRLAGILAEYFRDHPDATQQETDHFIVSLPQRLSERDAFDIVFYEGGPLFARVEVNNEMDDYLAVQRTVLFPKQPSDIVWTQQFGGGIRDVLAGDNLLMVFLAYEYQGPLRDTCYSTFYLGYSDRYFSQGVRIDQGKSGAFLKEFQVWSTEDSNCERKN